METIDQIFSVSDNYEINKNDLKFLKTLNEELEYLERIFIF